MNVPLLTWCCIASVFAVMLLVRIYHLLRSHFVAGHRLVEMGREWEELYVPGDRLIKGEYDYDEFDDM